MDLGEATYEIISKSRENTTECDVAVFIDGNFISVVEENNLKIMFICGIICSVREEDKGGQNTREDWTKFKQRASHLFGLKTWK